MASYIEPTPKTLSLCDNCFSLTSTIENLQQMAKKNGLRFNRALEYLQEQTDCRMCRWVLSVSDDTLWANPLDSLDIGIRSQRSKGQSEDRIHDFDSISIDTFGFSPPGTNDRRSWVSFSVVASPGDPAARYISSRPAISNPRALESTNLICQWFKHCETSHAMCQPPVASLPTHVIDVEGTGNVRIVHAKGQQSRYAALTYCWGVAKQPVLLNRKNIESLTSNIPFDSLPLTIKDAIFITRALGLRYLWVDALCIIQEDSEDAGNELRSMATIYSNASITISASCASSVKDGFLQTRPAFSFEDGQESIGLPYRCADGTLGRIDSFLQSKYSRYAEPITKRAWTLQEHFLSPRLVIYGKEAVLWECQTGRWNIEDLQIQKSTQILERNAKSPHNEETFRLNNALFDIQLKNALSKKTLTSDLRIEWQFLVSQYSRRKLTYASDKLNAISALANKFKSAFSDHEYTCGLFYSSKATGGDLLHQLLWYVSIPRRQERYRPPVAPSWSWASVDDPVQWRKDNVWQNVSTAREKASKLSMMIADIYYVVHYPWASEDNSNRALAEIVSYQPTDIRINYPLKGFTMMAELKIKGPLRYAELSITINEHGSLANACVTAPFMSQFERTPSEKLNVYLDTNVPPFLGQLPVWCLRLLEGHGLVLVKVGENVYERIGVFREEENLDRPPWVSAVQYWFLGTKDEIVTIV